MLNSLKRKGLLAFGMIFVLALSACNTSDFSIDFDEITESVSESFESSSSGDSDYEIITSLNRYIDLVNAAFDEVDYLEDDIYYYNSDVDSYAEYGYEPTFSCWYTAPDEYDYTLYDEVLNPSSELPQETRTQLMGYAENIISTMDTVENTCKDLDVYVSAQNYLDDDFAQGAVLVEELYAAMDVYYELHDETLDLVDDLFDEYENFEIDWDNPMDVGYGYMREDIDLAKEILEIVEDAYVDEVFDAATLAEMVEYRDALSANIDARTGVDKPNLSDSYVESYYDDFYDDLEVDFIPVAIRAERNFSIETVEDLGWDYSDMIDSYNWMIDYYNWYLDELNYSYEYGY